MSKKKRLEKLETRVVELEKRVSELCKLLFESEDTVIELLEPDISNTN